MLNLAKTKTAPVNLAALPVGNTARVISLKASGLTRRRLLDLGIVPGTEILALRRSPVGDPTAYLVRGTTIALRRDIARQIEVEMSAEEYDSKI
ncbi:MAG: FeoA family protein [Bacillota bacterium]|uniref:FeoA family protein n=1 Tax=Desulforudis sp. DRI-14 TaxID=3459793 RepID=UPI00347DF595